MAADLVFNGLNGPLFSRLKPVNNISPFTYADGSTYLEILNKMEGYIKWTLVPDVDSLLGVFVKRLNDFIESLEKGLEVDRETLRTIYEEFVQRVSDEIDLINNKTGAVDVQQITLTAPRTISINPLWPTNQPVEFVVKQDATGGRTVTLAGNIRGPLTVDPAPNAVTRFMLVPDGTGSWFTVQVPNTLADLDTRITALTKPGIDLIREETSTRVANLTSAVSTALANADAARIAFEKSTDEKVGENGFVFATFLANGVAGEKLSIFYSPDGKTLFGGNDNPVYAPADNQGVRDPSIIYRNGKFYVVHTSNNGADKDISIASSPTTAPGSWSEVAKISGASISTMNRMWAPEFIEDGENLYIFFSSVTAGDKGSMYYVRSTNVSLTQWTAPVAVNFTASPEHYIDGVPVKGPDNKYYMFYSTGASIERAVATTITGTWATDRTGNWAGWGTEIEGPEIVKDGNIYRAYFDRFGAGTGIHWSESSDLNSWSTPVKLVTTPYATKPGETLRHGSAWKLTNPASRNAVLAAMSMPRSGGNHSEFQNGPGIPVPKDVATLLSWVVRDTNEDVNNSLVTFNDADDSFTLNRYTTYAISVTASAKEVTGVNRTYIEMVGADGITSHLRDSGGAEDVFSFNMANFKPRAAGEKVKFKIYANWTGPQASAAVPLRVRFTDVSAV